MTPEHRLAILVPDGAYPLVLTAFLSVRTKSLGLERIEFEIVKDAFRDSSREAVELLRPFRGKYSHALMLRDLHGSGKEAGGVEALETTLKEEMITSGWNSNRCEAIVVDPEIESWLRFDSSHLHQLLRDRARRRIDWDELLLQPLIDEIILKHGGRNSHGKPFRPKEVFEELLRYFGIQRSNALYGHLAGVESLRGCAVSSFNRLGERLRSWFPARN